MFLSQVLVFSYFPLIMPNLPNYLHLCFLHHLLWVSLDVYYPSFASACCSFIEFLVFSLVFPLINHGLIICCYYYYYLDLLYATLTIKVHLYFDPSLLKSLLWGSHSSLSMTSFSLSYAHDALTSSDSCCNTCVTLSAHLEFINLAHLCAHFQIVILLNVVELLTPSWLAM